jgi:hypothetical protein
LCPIFTGNQADGRSIQGQKGRIGMSKVFVHAEIKATWPGGHLEVMPETAQEVAAAGVQLAVEELGAYGARRLLRRELRRYPEDYPGAGRGEGDGD